MVGVTSRRISRVRRYSGIHAKSSHAFRLRDYHPLWSAFPVPLIYACDIVPLFLAEHTDPITLPGLSSGQFGLFPLRSPLLRKSRSISFPPGTKMFQFPGLSSARYLFTYECSGSRRSGFPHSAIPGSKDVCSSPGLIAAYHGLRQPPSPRHPPCALSNLTISLHPPRPNCGKRGFHDISRAIYSFVRLLRLPKCQRTPLLHNILLYILFPMDCCQCGDEGI